MCYIQIVGENLINLSVGVKMTRTLTEVKITEE